MRTVCLVGLIAGGHSGVPRYAAALIRGLDTVADEFPALRLRLLTTERGAALTSTRRIDIDVARGPAARLNQGPGRILAEQLLAARARADLLHFFDLSGPVLSPARPFVTTVHDAGVAHGFEPVRYAYKRLLQPWALRRARATVAVSAFARDEAIRHLEADPARITVVHSGPGLVESGGNGATPHPDRYLLFVGTLAASKNLPFLVRAYEQAAVDLPLLIVGGRRGEGYDTLRRAVAASPAARSIRIVGDAGDGDLDPLYRGATALLLPSRYEGFGFTPLEAMARGCPVLASDIPAVREVSGSGALLLPLGDETAWAGAIRRVVDDERLRGELRERGAETVSRYSWEETARGVCRVLESVVS